MDPNGLSVYSVGGGLAPFCFTTSKLHNFKTFFSPYLNLRRIVVGGLLPPTKILLIFCLDDDFYLTDRIEVTKALRNIL
jgi:hypothetical protein